MRHKCQVKVQCDCIQCKRKNQRQHKHSGSNQCGEDFYPESIDFGNDFLEDEFSIDYIFETEILDLDDNR